MRLYIAPETINRLKSATDELVHNVGGQVRAAELLGVSQSTISRWCSVDHPDALVPLPAVVMLERGKPPAVTKALAEFADLPLASAPPAEPSRMEIAAELAKETGEAQAAVIRHIATGTPNSAAEAEREVVEAERSLARTRAMLAADRVPRERRVVEINPKGAA